MSSIDDFALVLALTPLLVFRFVRAHFTGKIEKHKLSPLVPEYPTRPAQIRKHEIFPNYRCTGLSENKLTIVSEGLGRGAGYRGGVRAVVLVVGGDSSGDGAAPLVGRARPYWAELRARRSCPVHLAVALVAHASARLRTVALDAPSVPHSVRPAVLLPAVHRQRRYRRPSARQHAQRLWVGPESSQQLLQQVIQTNSRFRVFSRAIR